MKALELNVPEEYRFGSYDGPPIDELKEWAAITNEGFGRFADDVLDIQHTPMIPVIVLPCNMEFLIPDYYEFTERTDLHFWNLLQVGIWLHQDPVFTKPVHLLEPTMRQLRLVSSLSPQIQSVSHTMRDHNLNKDFGPRELRAELFEYYSAADDQLAIDKLHESIRGNIQPLIDLHY